MRKKRVYGWLLMLLMLWPAVALAADEPSLTIEVIHADTFGGATYYLDLLAPPQPDDVSQQVVMRDGEELAYYTEPLLEFSYNDWVPAYRNGRLMLEGELVGKAASNGRIRHVFRGNIPPDFSVVVQQPTGIMAVSNVISPGQRYARVLFDMRTHQAQVIFQWGDGLVAFCVRWALMVIADCLILIAVFRYQKPFNAIGVSLLTKGLLNLALALAYPHSRVLTVVVLLICLLVAAPIEYVLHFVLQKEMEPERLRTSVAISTCVTGAIALLPYLLGL